MSTLVRANAWLENASDWLNPILVKETRQALKSRQFIVTFLLMLIASWLISVFGTLAAGDSLEFGSAGRWLFAAYFVVLELAIFVVVPYSAYRGLLNERDQTTLELLNITSLSPRQLVWGKLWSAMAQVFIFYSAIAPFIAFTSMLQGFDVALVAYALAISILATLCLTMLTLMLAAIPQGKQLQGLMTGVIFLGLLMVVSMIFGSVEWLTETISFDETGFWVATGFWMVAGLSFFFLFTQIATSHLTFEADNRSTGIRIACSAQFVLYWLMIGVSQYMLGSPGATPVTDVAMWSVLYVAVSGFFAATESDFVSRRVRRGIPKTTLLRLLAAPWLPGGHRGFLYLLLHLALIPVLAFLLLGRYVSSHMLPALSWEYWWIITALLYVLIYVGLGSAFGRALRRVSAEVRPMHVRVIVFILLAMGMIVPSLPLFLPRDYEWMSRWLRVANPFAILGIMSGGAHTNDLDTHELIVLWSAAGLGLFLNVRPMFAGVREVLRHPVMPAVVHIPNPALTSDGAPPHAIRS